MKKAEEKETTVKKTVDPSNNKKLFNWINIGLVGLGLLLVLGSIFIKTGGIYVGLSGVALNIAGVVMWLIRSKEHIITKGVLGTLFIAILLTWVIPVNDVFSRIGLKDIPVLGYYAGELSLVNVLYLLTLAMFYGILSQTDGYKRLVCTIAGKLERGKLIFVLLVLVVFVLLTTITTSMLAVLLFVPFVLSILSRMKIDKLTAFIVTFGAILVGGLCSPWGTEALTRFNHFYSYYFQGFSIKTGFSSRIIIESIALVLFLLLAFFRVKKIATTKKELEAVEDKFEIKDSVKKANMVPMIILLSILAVLFILGFVDWKTNFGITVFERFHTWLTGLTLGKQKIFSTILGMTAKPFGNWGVQELETVLLIFAILAAVIYRVRLSQVFESAIEGIKKMLKPIGVFVLVSLIFATLYFMEDAQTPIFSTINTWTFGLTKSFNPFITTVLAFVSSIFQTDNGYSAYLVAQQVMTLYPEKYDIVHTIYVSMYGLVQLLLPSGALLMFGLKYTNVEYKTWFKYVYRFVVAIFVVMLIVFTFITYVF